MDLTQHSDAELSLIVLNTEHLYRAYMRCDDHDDLRTMVDGEGLVYTEAQFEELCEDLDSEDRD